MTPRALRPIVGLVTALVGATTGVASLGLHDANVASWLLALAAPIATVIALPAGWLRCGFGVGWVCVLVIAVLGRPEGDYVVSADFRGYGLLLAGLGVLMGSIVTLPVRNRGAGGWQSGKQSAEESVTSPQGT